MIRFWFKGKAASREEISIFRFRSVQNLLRRNLLGVGRFIGRFQFKKNQVVEGGEDSDDSR